MDDDLQAPADEPADYGEMDGEPEQSDVKTLQVRLRNGESGDEGKARIALAPEYHAVDSIHQLNQITAFREADLTHLADQLEQQVLQLKDGNLGQAESMLAAQAHTLDALFHHFLIRAARNIKNEFSVVDRLFKLAMKAQSQCRATLDSLASIKKPRPELVKQTNIAHGYQQVNNFPEKDNPPNELLEKTDGERLDTGTPAEAVKGDQTLEAVGEEHRAKYAGRTGQDRSERL